MQKRLIVCAAHNTTPGWRWIGHHLDPDRYDFRVFDCIPLAKPELWVKKPYLPRYRAAAQATFCTYWRGADLLVSHHPLMTCWVSLFTRALGLRTPHLAFAFNFTELPTGRRAALMRRAFATVDRFVVPSTLERSLYARTFDLPATRFDVLPWGIEKPNARPGTPTPAPPGEYACAIGGEGRDYATLMAAARANPEIRIVCIGRPRNFAGLDIPANVKTLTNTSADTAWKLLEGARFAIVPLLHRKVPCGHVTLVAAMYHEKAIVVTDSDGVADYVRHDDNALLVPPGDAAALGQALRRLWNDADLCAHLGAAGLRFAHTHCTEAATAAYFLEYLQRHGL